MGGMYRRPVLRERQRDLDHTAVKVVNPLKWISKLSKWITGKANVGFCCSRALVNEKI